MAKTGRIMPFGFALLIAAMLAPAGPMRAQQLAAAQSPPPATKLFLEKTIRVPLRIVFEGRPDNHSNHFDVGTNHPTPVPQKGEVIVGTTYKVVSFVPKYKQDTAAGIMRDVSELTIQDTETNETRVLVMGMKVDPDLYALFKYFWKKPVEIKVKRGATFTLDPETDVNYKLLDVTDTAAKIKNLKTNEDIAIPLLKDDETFHLLK